MNPMTIFDTFTSTGSSMMYIALLVWLMSTSPDAKNFAKGLMVFGGFLIVVPLLFTVWVMLSA